MILALDAMGGDNAPSEIVKGAVMYAKKFKNKVILIGVQEKIKNELYKFGEDLDNIEIVNTTEIITNEDSPTQAIKQKRDSSMVKGLELVKSKEVDAFISAGNTGALLTGSLLKIGRIKGISRPALAPIIPTDTGIAMLIDAGANATCKPENLLQFSFMGNAYMEKVLKIKKPKVGLVNVGSEEGKGNEIVKNAYNLIKESSVNFYGNLEARDIPKGVADIIVCDGFVGNIILKLTEGLGEVFYRNIKNMFTKNIITYASAILIKNGLKDFKKKMDYNEFGGAPFLGIDGVVIKAHGSTQASSIYYSLMQAEKFVGNDVIGEIKNFLEKNHK